jgi:hypothetical protein
MLEGIGRDPGVGLELIQVVLVGFAGARRRGAEQPGGRPSKGRAEIARHLAAGKGRDAVGEWGTMPLTGPPATA